VALRLKTRCWHEPVKSPENQAQLGFTAIQQRRCITFERA
jgi:hypothetical protein